MNQSDGFVCLVIQYIFQVFCQILTYCYHVQLRDSVFFYRQRQWDPVLLNQHLRFLYDSNAMPVSLFSQKSAANCVLSCTSPIFIEEEEEVEEGKNGIQK